MAAGAAFEGGIDTPWISSMLPTRQPPTLDRLVSKLHRKIGLRAPHHIISFPKSGRTWLIVMLEELGIVVEYTHSDGDEVLGIDFKDLQVELPNGRRIVLNSEDIAYCGNILEDLGYFDRIGIAPHDTAEME